MTANIEQFLEEVRRRYDEASECGPAELAESQNDVVVLEAMLSSVVAEIEHVFEIGDLEAMLNRAVCSEDARRTLSDFLPEVTHAERRQHLRESMGTRA